MSARAPTDSEGEAQRRRGAPDAVFAGFALALPLIAVLAAKGTVVALLVAAVAAGLLHWRRGGGVPGFDRTLALLLAVLLAWALAVSIWSRAPPSASLLVLRVAVIFAAGLLLLALARTPGPAAGEKAGRALLVGMALAYAYLAVEILFDFPLTRVFGGEEIKDYHDPAHWTNRGVAVLAMLAWPAAAVLWRRFGAVALAVPGVLAFLLLFLENRAALLGLAAGLALAAIGLLSRRTHAPADGAAAQQGGS